MAVTVYNSTDASAPVLTGQNGSLITVLDAVLVNGYGSQTAAGWTKPYSGTNLAVYRQGAGNSRYLDVNDANNQYPLMRGFEAMTGVGVGTGAFPSAATSNSTGVFWSKSTTNDATARPWTIVATQKAFYMWINVNSGGAPFAQGMMYFFGDFVSYRPGDAYNTLIAGNATASNSVSTFTDLTTSIATTSPGHFIARSYTQFGTAVPSGQHSDYIRCSTSIGRGTLTYPNNMDGSFTLCPVWIHEPNLPTYPVRGEMPGLWAGAHLAPANHGDTVTGSATGGLSGKTIQFFNTYFNGTVVAQPGIEISNTW